MQKMADSEGIEPPPVRPGLVFETNATNQHLPTIRITVYIFDCIFPNKHYSCLWELSLLSNSHGVYNEVVVDIQVF